MIVTIGSGEVRGEVAGPVARFLGVPYGEPPVGDRRFAAPAPTQPWSGTFDATTWGPRPPQPEMRTPLDPAAAHGTTDEDCLRVNVFTPGTDGRRPVMVWFHGGGLAFGSANDYDGSALAGANDVVVVTVGYRLGLLGFADLAACGAEYEGSASNGFRDQVLALRWVRDNIAAFGGDPGCVTVFGQSGGAVSVLALLGAPTADGLFQRAIALSGGPPQSEPPEVVPVLAGTLGVEPRDLPERLRRLPLGRLLEIQQGIGFTAGGSIDGVVVTRHPVEAIAARGAAGVPIVAGTTRDEGTLLTAMMEGLRPAVLDVLAEGLAAGTFDGDDPAAYLGALRASMPGADAADVHTEVWTDHFRRTSVRVAEAASAAGAGGWLYRFDLRPTGALAALGATHAADLGFVFDSLADAAAPDLYDGSRAEVGAVAARWSATLASFARHGHPNVAQPTWDRYLPDRTCLLVDTNDRVVTDLDRARQVIWGDRTAGAT